MADNCKIFAPIENYIYLYHTKQFIVIPVYPESINDQMAAQFNTTMPLARSAPIFSYMNSGPRTVGLNLKLHREAMAMVNRDVSNVKLDIGDDYVDTFIKQIQAVSVPMYASSSKMVDPPLVALRIGNEIFIKGVVTSGCNVTYELPILKGDKYAQVSVSFTISEVEPYDAETVAELGSYRGIDTTLERNLWSTRGTSNKTNGFSFSMPKIDKIVPGGIR